tara:strand:- start:4820 stop:5374 length:555 start_codon:yes stop_codon:yes gene_type:complete
MPGKLELIYGPMFSGKTTKLIERFNDLKKFSKCLCINYALDNRYSKNKIVSHDQVKMDCIIITNFQELFSEKNFNNFIEAQWILVNEAQFFSNLKIWTEFCIKILNKNLIVSGLDLDYKQNQFGELLDLKKMATQIYKMSGKCGNTNCRNLSEFSHRVSYNKELIFIGSNEYIALCKNCYKMYN